jgi:hypothetical protein
VIAAVGFVAEASGVLALLAMPEATARKRTTNAENGWRMMG